MTSGRSNLAVPVEEAGLQLPARFEDFLDRKKLAKTLRKGSKRQLESVLGAAGRGVRTVAVLESGKRMEVVFTPATKKLLDAGVYELPVDRKMKLLRVDARDKHSRIRELGKVRHVQSKARLLANVVVSGAHLISAADMQASLVRIERKLGEIDRFLQEDRIGELRAAHQEACEALAHRDPKRRGRELRRVSRDLLKLEARFFQTSKKTLSAIKDPSDIGTWEALTTLQSRAEARLNGALSSGLQDLRYSEAAWQLRRLILAELQDEDGFVAAGRSFSGHLDEIRPLLTEKVGYRSVTERRQAARMLQELQRGCVQATEELLFTCGNDEFVLATEVRHGEEDAGD